MEKITKNYRLIIIIILVLAVLVVANVIIKNPAFRRGVASVPLQEVSQSEIIFATHEPTPNSLILKANISELSFVVIEINGTVVASSILLQGDGVNANIKIDNEVKSGDVLTLTLYKDNGDQTFNQDKDIQLTDTEGNRTEARIAL